jgi:hypothetical protein
MLVLACHPDPGLARAEGSAVSRRRCVATRSNASVPSALMVLVCHPDPRRRRGGVGVNLVFALSAAKMWRRRPRLRSLRSSDLCPGVHCRLGQSKTAQAPPAPAAEGGCATFPNQGPLIVLRLCHPDPVLARAEGSAVRPVECADARNGISFPSHIRWIINSSPPAPP